MDVKELVFIETNQSIVYIDRYRISCRKTCPRRWDVNKNHTVIDFETGWTGYIDEGDPTSLESIYSLNDFTLWNEICG